MADNDQPSSGQLLFLQLISMFQAAAMQQLGKIVDPATGEVDKDLSQAKVSIDILDVLKEKTKGNLTDVEGEFLDKVLFELHMNYVDERKASEKPQSKVGNEHAGEEEGEAKGDRADASGGGEEEEQEEEGQKDS